MSNGPHYPRSKTWYTRKGQSRRGERAWQKQPRVDANRCGFSARKPRMRFVWGMQAMPGLRGRHLKILRVSSIFLFSNRPDAPYWRSDMLWPPSAERNKGDIPICVRCKKTLPVLRLTNSCRRPPQIMGRFILSRSLFHTIHVEIPSAASRLVQCFACGCAGSDDFGLNGN